MKWHLSVKELHRDNNRSEFGYFYSVAVAEVRAFRRQFERKRRFAGLKELSDFFGYVWSPWEKGQPPDLQPQEGRSDRRQAPLKRVNGDGFDETLRLCLRDIGRVIDAGQGQRLLPRAIGGAWAKLVGGYIDIYWLAPLRRSGGEATDYSRLVIVLYPGAVNDKKYNLTYEWELEYCSETRFTVSETIDKFRPTSIDQVCDKVFIISNADGDRGVLKYEKPNLNLARYESTWMLYQYLFESTPKTHNLTLGDAEYIRGAELDNGNNYNGSPNDPQQEFLFFYGDGKGVVRRMQHCDMADSLENMVENAKRSDKKSDQFKTLYSKFFTEEVFELLGKLASVDTVTGNGDRLKGTRNKKRILSINIKNIDFNSALLPVAIDNIDPASDLISVTEETASRPRESWPAFSCMCTPPNREVFAVELVDALIAATTLFEGAGKTKKVVTCFADANLKQSCVAALLRGLTEGVRAMQGIVDVYEAKAADKNWGLPADAICARIRAIEGPRTNNTNG